jgi:hypothetical protein
MHLSERDIQAEHEAALRSLSVAQQRAFARVADAESRSWREGGGVEARLQLSFVLEAAARSVIPANDR